MEWSRTECACCEAKQKIHNAIGKDATFTIYQLDDKNVSVIAPDGIVGGRVLYETLGMTPPTKAQKLFDTEKAEYYRYRIRCCTYKDIKLSKRNDLSFLFCLLFEWKLVKK